MIEKLKQRVTDMIDKGELEWFMRILHLFSHSGDNDIERSSKSLIHLLDNDRHDTIEM